MAVLNDFQAGENLQYLQKQLSVLPFLKDPELMARTIFRLGNLILREGKDVEFLADDLSDAYISMEQADKNKQLVRAKEKEIMIRNEKHSFQYMALK